MTVLRLCLFLMTILRSAGQVFYRNLPQFGFVWCFFTFIFTSCETRWTKRKSRETFFFLKKYLFWGPYKRGIGWHKAPILHQECVVTYRNRFSWAAFIKTCEKSQVSTWSFGPRKVIFWRGHHLLYPGPCTSYSVLPSVSEKLILSFTGEERRP